ncbi:MAG: hypothetical protein M1284_00700 [Candidatus Parvarchaeota archaeon]|nr:hypothetical protein [Candidatus Parvarchaeota archaeon]
MVNIRLKQAAALFIAIAFVSSIFFFFPHVSSTSPITYYIVVPSALLRPNSSYLGNSIRISGSTDDIIALSRAVPISNLIASNISNMLEFTESMLKQENLSYNTSNGNIQCVFSDQFVYSLCANSSEGTSWALSSVASNGALLSQSLSPADINLNSISSNSTYILAFYGAANSSGNATTVPPIIG